MNTKKRAWYYVVFATMAMLLCAVTTALLAACSKVKPLPPGPEEPSEGAGVYYYDVAERDEEYLITLSEGYKFSFVVADTLKIGDYTLSGEALTLTSAEGDWTQSATLKDDKITLVYQDAEMQFLKKKYFTVSFETAGGSAVDAVSVLNGKTVEKPADPVRDGFGFIGWYADAEFKQPFAFGTEAVRGDVTIHARWAEKAVGQPEYVVSYDLGYDGEAIDSRETVGGKLYAPAVPAEREGYAFKGWWISMENDASRLSYKYEESTTTFDADTTLFALWQPAESEYDYQAPLVSIESGAAVWDSVGAAGYIVKVTAPDGSVTVDDRYTTSTTFPVTFDTAGAYRVEVTAVKAGGTAVSATTVRYFVHKALARVSGFSVAEPSMLVFQGVDNAEKYLITIECGNKDHKHTDFDNGSSKNYNFANCEMKEGGIVFTVTAQAEGYADSKAVFVYERRLDGVQGLAVDSDTVYWNAVKNATGYEVKVGGDTYTVTEPKFSLKTFAKGEYNVAVTPKAKGYNSPAPASLSYEKTTLAVPANIRIVGTIVSWDAVEGADSYEVKIGDKTFPVAAGATEYDVADALDWVDADDYRLSVKAVSGETSSVSDEIDIRYNAMYATVSYSASIFSWRPVVGAVSYDVQINDGEIVTIGNGDSFYEVATFTQAGLNTLKVRFNDGTRVSDWAETTVYAHAVTFDSRGGSSAGTLYKAVGDKLELPVTSKTGYDFANWYNAPGGPESNGAVYADEIFERSGELVLYAWYTPKAFTVNYNDGTDTAESATVYYNRDYRLMVPVSGDGTSVFGGWFSAPYGAGTAYTDAKGNSLAPWTRLDENATVYAFWIDSVLKYTPVGNGYAVTKGDRIDLVTEITIPAQYKGVNVTEIAGSAFLDCETLTEINIPDTVTRIAAETAFSGCTNLKAVNVYAAAAGGTARYTSQDGVLFDCGDASSPRAPQPAFMPSAKTGAYRIPDGVEIIPRRAFAESKLTKITIPASVKEIGVEAFADCSLLADIVFERAKAGTEQPLTIGDRAFRNCEGLTSVTLPTRLASVSLGRYTIENGRITTANATDAFSGCTNLAEINVAKGGSGVYASADGVLLTDNESTVLYYPAAKESEDYTFPAGITKIADGAFFECTDFYSENLEIPGTVTYVGECAFYYCYYIDAVTFKAGLSSVVIGDYAFRDSGIESLTFEENSRVAEIGKGAFYNCEYLDGGSIVIPAGMERIGDEAFYGCGSIEVSIAESTNNLEFGDGVFYNCTIEVLTLPKNVTALSNFLNGVSVGSIVVSEENPVFKSEGGVLYNKAGTELLMYPSGKDDLTEFAVPEGVTAIADGAFKGNSSLETITLPASMTSVGNEAFRESYVVEVIFTAGGTEDLEIGDYAFYDCGYLETIELPERAKSVGAYSFAKASWLDTITLGGTVTIGDYAFYRGGGYGEIVIPASVETIGRYSFAEARFCSVTFAENSGLKTIGDYAFAEINDGDELDDPIEIPASVTYIGNYAFYYVRTSSITFEAGSMLEVIGAYAFAKGYHETFTIPASVKSIGAYAFYSNSYLEEVVFEDGDVDLVFGTEYDGEYGRVFNSCWSLTTINFPGRLTVLEDSAFESNYYIESVTFGSAGYPSRLTTIGNYAFKYSDLESIVIPASVRNTADRIAIGEQAFYNCSFTEITFEAGGSKDTAPLTIGKSAFASNYDLASITLPSRLASFTDADGNTVAPFANGSDVFANCALTEINIEGDGVSEYVSKEGVVYTAGYLELILCPQAKSGKVTVPATVTKIADRAFYYCTELSEAEFESGSACTEIGSEAFYRCYELEALALPANVTKIGYNAFFQCEKLASLTLPAALEVFDSSIIEACGALQNLNVGEGSATYKSIDGVLFTADGKKLVCYLSTRVDTEYSVPEGVGEIGEKAFNSNRYLTKVTLPKSLTLVGKSAFNGCTGLATAEFAEGGSEVLVIAASAFQRCALTSISLPARVAAIENYAFQYCSALKSVAFAADGRLNSLGDSVFASSGLLSIALPKGLIEIGDGVFLNCSALTTATLSEGLTSIGNGTFSGCSALATVNLPASLTAIGTSTFYNCSSLENVNFAASSQLEIIPNGTFTNCTSLESIELPASLTEIPDKDQENSSAPSFFQGCTALKRVTFAEGSKCVKIGDYAFKGTALEQFAIPASVTSVGYGAFEGTGLTSITIPKTVTKLGAYLFQNCTSLTYVRLDAQITTLPDSMFANCTSLASFTVPASVTGFAPSVFGGCTALAFIDVEAGSASFVAKGGVLYTTDWSVYFFPAAKDSYEIPKEVTYLPDGFFAANGIGTVTIENGNTSFKLEDEVLYNADKTEVIFLSASKTSFNIPVTLTSEKIVATLKACPALESITVEEGNEAYQVAFGALYDMNWNLLVFPAAKTEYVIPKQVTSLPDGAFAGTNLVSVTYEDGGTADLNLTTNETGAFQGCKYLEAVELPSRTRLIDGLVFADCSALREINLPDTVNEIKYLTKMTYYSPFYNCSALEEINVDPGNETYKSSDGVLYDGSWTCLVFPVAKTSFAIPHEVTSLKALSGASGLVSVTFEKDGTGAEVAGETLTLADNVFSSLQALETVELPSRIAGIKSDMFKGCTGLMSVSVAGDSEKYKIVGGALYDAEWNLLVFPEGRTEYVIPAAVTVISFKAFYGSTVLQSVTYEKDSAGNEIPGQPLDIIDTQETESWYGTIEETGGPFQNCTALEKVELPSRLTKLAISMFDGCEKLKQVNIPSGIKSIPDYAFYDCSSLESIVLPSSVETIGRYAFSGCVNIQTIYLSSNIATVGRSAFDYWTMNQTINVAFAADALPSGWDSRWIGSYASGSLTVNYGVSAGN